MRTKALFLVVGVFLVAAGQTVQTLDPRAVQPVHLLGLDFNRDGYPDLAVACHSSNSVVVFENTRSPCGSFAEPVEWELQDSPVALAAGFFWDPVCPKAPKCFPYTGVFPNIVAVTQYQPGIVRFCPVEAKEPFLKLVPGGPLGVSPLPFTTLTHLVVADFNNDGAEDIAVLDGISMKIGFYFGARAALYSPILAQDSTAKPPDKVIDLEGEQAYFLATADLDRDGILDLAISVDGNLLFYPGNGEAPTKLKLGKKLVNFALADFNRDGYLDIAVVDPEFGALTAVFNRGCWQFERGPRLKFDGQPVAVVAGDFDRNGLVDLAVVEKEANHVSFVVNELSNLGEIKRPDPCKYTVAAPEKVDSVGFRVVKVVEVGKNPVALAVEDFDLNGFLDVAVAILGENKVQLIYNPCLCQDCSGDILCSSTTLQMPEAPPSPGEPPKLEARPPSASGLVVVDGSSFNLPRSDLGLIAVGNLDGDGVVDLVLGATTEERIFLFQGTGDGGFVSKGDVWIGLRPGKLLVADIDGNGFDDVVVVSWREAEAAVLWSQGSFLFNGVTFFGLPKEVKDVTALKLTDSAREDLVLLTDTRPMVWSIPQRGAIVEWSTVPSFLSSLKPLSTALYAYGIFEPNKVVTVHYSNNPGDLVLSWGGSLLGSFEVPHEGAIQAIAVADVDGDGLFDVLGLEEGGKVRVWLIKKQE